MTNTPIEQTTIEDDRRELLQVERMMAELFAQKTMLTMDGLRDPVVECQNRLAAIIGAMHTLLDRIEMQPPMTRFFVDSSLSTWRDQRQRIREWRDRPAAKG